MIIAIAVSVLAASVHQKRKPVTILIDGQPQKIVTMETTVAEALEKEQIVIGPKDKLEPAPEVKLVKNDTITIKRAVNVSVLVDDKELSILSAEENVDMMLKTEGITLRNDDKLSHKKETKLSQGMKIEIVRVDKKTFTDSITLDYATIIKTDSSLANTTRRTTQEGKQGEQKIVTDVVYENGKEVSRTVVSDTVVAPPKDKIIVQGTYPVMPISRGGDPMPYSRVFKARATAYYAVRGVGKTYTASGRLAVRNPDGYSTIAVDPKVIPYGTRLFIENYGFAIAADTGTAIIGDTIDVYFDTYREACNWAVKYVNVYVLK